MPKVNHEVVNTLAMEIQNTNDVEVREMYGNMLMEELNDWIEYRVKSNYFNKIKGVGGNIEQVTSLVQETVWKVAIGKGSKFSPEKGNFVGFVYKALQNPINGYVEYQLAQTRDHFTEGQSLDTQVNDDADNTLGDMVSDVSVLSIEVKVSSEMHVSNLLDDFEVQAKDGVRKVQALRLMMYPEMYGNDEVAEALGYEQYSASARKKVQRVKEEFQKFMSHMA
ncbi:hypothetical protein Q9R38_26265 [Priestia aryabhattai]|uniref:hypothetical protein n=1 Tax=Priestia aryabhattai TaxID=412384 RepID=UPI0028821C1E|nr:hypothetical protein [Priestia aryabhattai]MDT0150050.1 hypothetical protein [Priestia aryabhattai]MDT0155620.1 hypothetical protein [Priestia aryabhattai]